MSEGLGMVYVLLFSWPIIGVLSQAACLIVTGKWRNPIAAVVALLGGLLVGWIGMIAFFDVLALRKK